MVLSDGFWKRRFGCDPRIVGTELRVDGSNVTIVGVLDANVDVSIFNVDSGSCGSRCSSIRTARAMDRRLSPPGDSGRGVSVALAQAHACLTGEAFRRRYPQVTGPNDTFTVAPFQEALVRALALFLAGLDGRGRPSSC